MRVLRSGDRGGSDRRVRSVDADGGEQAHEQVHPAVRKIGWFGTDVADLVDGLTKIGRFSYVSREEEQAETFRKMVLAMASDLRVVLVKLADRLHNMQTLRFIGRQVVGLWRDFDVLFSPVTIAPPPQANRAKAASATPIRSDSASAS